jgi:hypothetical protein
MNFLFRPWANNFDVLGISLISGLVSISPWFFFLLFPIVIVSHAGKRRIGYR